MKHFRATLALVSLMSIGGTAGAAIYPITFERGVSPGTWFGADIMQLDAYSRIDMSEVFLGALSISWARLAGVAPALQMESPDSYAIELPYKKIAGEIDKDNDDWDVRLLSVDSDGGMSISIDALQSNGRQNVASTGGSFSITALRVAPSSNAVYANIVGGNGVGAQNMVRLWDAVGFSGSTLVNAFRCPLTPRTPCEPSSLVGFQFDELHITDHGFKLMAQSLGLTDFGKSSLAGITTYGSISVSSVPEPASVGLMLLGLLGLVAVTGAGRR